MPNTFYIILGVGIGILVIIAVILILTRKRKKEKNPLISRAENMTVMINQRIFSLNSKIAKLDYNITALLATKENGDLTSLETKISLEDIPEKIEKIKSEVNSYIADIKDLQEYKEEIEIFLKDENEKDWKELEELLNHVKEKFQYRYVTTT